MLTLRLREAILIEDRELVHGGFPMRAGRVQSAVMLRSASQISLVAASSVGKVAAGLDDFAQARVDALERVGGVDHAPHVGRKGEERNDVRPRAAPRRDDRRKPLAPRAARKGVERRARGLRARRRVDRPQRAPPAACAPSSWRSPGCGESDARCRSAASSRDTTAASASLMPLSPSVTAIRMSWQPRVLRSVKTFIQNFAPSVCSIQRPRMSRVPSGSTASAR